MPAEKVGMTRMMEGICREKFEHTKCFKLLLKMLNPSSKSFLDGWKYFHQQLHCYENYAKAFYSFMFDIKLSSRPSLRSDEFKGRTESLSIFVRAFKDERWKKLLLMLFCWKPHRDHKVNYTQFFSHYTFFPFACFSLSSTMKRWENV